MAAQPDHLRPRSPLRRRRASSSSKASCPPSDLEVLRRECGRLVDERDREMDRHGVDTLDLDHRGRRYFVHAYDRSPEVRRFLFSDLMAEVARTALGDTVYLFNEQYVVKAAERGMQFGWHQDSGSSPTHTRHTSRAGSRSTTSAKATAPSTCCPTHGPARATSSRTSATRRPTT